MTTFYDYHELEMQLVKLQAIINDQGRAIENGSADNARLRAALEAVEWVRYGASGYICPWCKTITGFYNETHKPDCQRQIALGLVQP